MPDGENNGRIVLETLKVVIGGGACVVYKVASSQRDAEIMANRRGSGSSVLDSGHNGGPAHYHHHDRSGPHYTWGEAMAKAAWENGVCFAESSQVLTCHGYKGIADINVGDSILTCDEEGKLIANKVLGNTCSEGSFLASKICTTCGAEVTVTNEHLLLRTANTSDTGTLCSSVTFSGKCLEYIEASDTLIGDTLPIYVSSGEGGEGKIAWSQIEKTKADITLSRRFALRTQRGTAIVRSSDTEGILLSTECGLSSENSVIPN
mmetsp:Transcript_63147/g.150557  ORF Transcript_63147/g.150557 Transcript_63147/m.150557 type:complete len:263 (+) Transcript_63147:80-868(+)